MCMEKTIGLAVDTEHPYFGRIFVTGMSDEKDCVRQFNSRYTKGPFKNHPPSKTGIWVHVCQRRRICGHDDTNDLGGR